MSPVSERSAYPLQNYIIMLSLLTSVLESFGHKSTCTPSQIYLPLWENVNRSTTLSVYDFADSTLSCEHPLTIFFLLVTTSTILPWQSFATTLADTFINCIFQQAHLFVNTYKLVQNDQSCVPTCWFGFPRSHLDY